MGSRTSLDVLEETKNLSLLPRIEQCLGCRVRSLVPMSAALSGAFLNKRMKWNECAMIITLFVHILASLITHFVRPHSITHTLVKWTPTSPDTITRKSSLISWPWSVSLNTHTHTSTNMHWGSTYNCLGAATRASQPVGTARAKPTQFCTRAVFTCLPLTSTGVQVRVGIVADLRVLASTLERGWHLASSFVIAQILSFT